MEIQQLLAEYCHGCDRCDVAHMAGVYWPDSWDDHGRNKASGPEYACIAISEILATTQVLSHHLGQSLIKLFGDEAGAETYFIAVTLEQAGDGTPICSQLGGRYVDRLERRDGEWKIKRREVIRDWSISLEVKQDFFAGAELPVGLRSSADLSYAALRMAHAGASG